MRIVDIIERKRDGARLSRAELEALVLGYTRGEVPDYQASAWLMAVCLRGMTPDEVAELTQVMAGSGQQIDLSHLGRRVGDKHSTGGVGDKTTLVVAPLAAACGVAVGKMSGRGLGATGGTIDKMESIPGLRVDLTAREFLDQLEREGIVVSGQSVDLAPADGKLYALRDVTGTVPSIPLIASSVMSKKLAAGAQTIVLDVKVGSGAFMKEKPRARELAQMMADIGRAAGRQVTAFVTDMSQPLGYAVGNSIEVTEAIQSLAGHGPADVRELVTRLAGEMVFLAELEPTREAALARAEQALDGGAALEAFRRMVRAQGGDLAYVDDPGRFPRAALTESVAAPESGWLAAIDAGEIARAAIALGAGREQKGDRVDLAVGLLLRAKVGERVERGQELLEIHANDEGRLRQARALSQGAYRIVPEAVSPPPLIHEVFVA